MLKLLKDYQFLIDHSQFILPKQQLIQIHDSENVKFYEKPDDVNVSNLDQNKPVNVEKGKIFYLGACSIKIT